MSKSCREVQDKSVNDFIRNSITGLKNSIIPKWSAAVSWMSDSGGLSGKYWLQRLLEGAGKHSFPWCNSHISSQCRELSYFLRLLSFQEFQLMQKLGWLQTAQRRDGLSGGSGSWGCCSLGFGVSQHVENTDSSSWAFYIYSVFQIWALALCFSCSVFPMFLLQGWLFKVVVVTCSTELKLGGVVAVIGELKSNLVQCYQTF